MTNFRILALLGMASLPALYAHDFFIMPDKFHVKPGQTMTIELCNGDAFPASETVASLERLNNTRMIGRKGSTAVTGFHAQNKSLFTTATVPESETAELILTALLTANTRSYDAAKFHTYLQEEGLAMVAKYREEHHEQDQPVKELFSKYAKALVLNGGTSPAVTRPVGLKIEIVPTVDPAQLKAGVSLPVQVLFDGKAAVGVRIEATWSDGEPGKATTVGVTDSHGKLSVPLQNGKCRLTTGYSQRYPEHAVANWETFFATLTFQVGGK